MPTYPNTSTIMQIDVDNMRQQAELAVTLNKSSDSQVQIQASVLLELLRLAEPRVR